MLGMLGEGFIMTLKIFALTLLGSMPLGILIALGRMSKIKPIQFIFQAYISIMRGTPLMLQMFAIYFAPYYVFGIELSPSSKFNATIVAFILNYAAYFAEIYRGGIEAMPVGQYEAAAVLGYSKFQTFMRIILPQVIKHILPSVTNEVITLVKDTSLAFTLAYQEMFSIGKQIANSQTSFMPFVIAGVFYYVFNSIVAFVMNQLENRLNYYR